MSRYIDAEKLKKHYAWWEDDRQKLFDSIVDQQPTVDAVPVIRCKDCRYVGTDATCCLVCNREGMGLRPFHVYHDDFCSYAERKE